MPVSISLEKLACQLGYEEQPELFAAIGRNLVTSVQITAAVYALEESADKTHCLHIRASRAKTCDQCDVISVRGVGSLLTQIARCCKPDAL